MLRTQEAVLYGTGPESMAVLCEAICLDAIEVTSATRVSIWFFDARGDLVCKRLLNARDGRFQEGAVIPHSATGAYLNAASQGLASMVTEDAPVVPAEGAADEVKARLDMLLVDSHNRPTAIFRVERCTGTDDWRPRDVTVLRNLAQTLASAIRDQHERSPGRDALAGLVGLADMGSVKQDLSWLRQGSEPSIWLQSVEAAQAFDALALDAPLPPDADPLFDIDEDEAY